MIQIYSWNADLQTRLPTHAVIEASDDNHHQDIRLGYDFGGQVPTDVQEY